VLSPASRATVNLRTIPVETVYHFRKDPDPKLKLGEKERLYRHPLTPRLKLEMISLKLSA